MRYNLGEASRATTVIWQISLESAVELPQGEGEVDAEGLIYAPDADGEMRPLEALPKERLIELLEDAKRYIAS